MITKLILLTLFIGLNYAFSQKSDFKIQFKIESKNELSGDVESITTNSIPESFDKEVVIHLQQDGSFLNTKNSRVTTFYDVTNEYIYTYSADTLYDAIPLYSSIDYRIAEYENRVFLAEMLQASGAGKAFGDLINLESLFGIENKEKNLRESIISKTSDDVTIYSVNGNEIARVSYAKTKIPKEYLEAFSKYLTYSVVIHPSIKEEILKTKRVPNFIQCTYSNVATKTTETYHLIESGKTEHSKNTIFTQKRALYQRDRSYMNGIIDSMVFSTMFHRSIPFDSVACFTEVTQLSNEGKNLSGILRLFEYILSTGHQPLNRLREIASLQESDSLLALFIYSLNSPQSQEEAESKVANFNYLNTLDIKYGYVMNIFAANYITPIDEFEATSYFYKALSKNPRITGAWLDLGKIYASTYNYDDAWKCFGIIMNMNASHPMANEIIEKEKALKRDYPNYFKKN